MCESLFTSGIKIREMLSLSDSRKFSASKITRYLFSISQYSTHKFYVLPVLKVNGDYRLLGFEIEFFSIANCELSQSNDMHAKSEHEDANHNS